LRIGYTRAARLVDQLHEAGILGPDLGGTRGRDYLGDDLPARATVRYSDSGDARQWADEADDGEQITDEAVNEAASEAINETDAAHRLAGDDDDGWENLPPWETRARTDPASLASPSTAAAADDDDDADAPDDSPPAPAPTKPAPPKPAPPTIWF
jgi:S-DNA-T family DNA segregation ATPase FtsK/SpoIIIE